MLHIVNKSPLERNALDSCLSAAQGGALLLTEDAVYAATRGNAAAGKITAAMAGMKVYVLGPDLDARGMTDRLLEDVTSVDYGGFVDLVAEYPTNQSWL